MNALSILATTSHTPFFIAGGVLALWAVVLSAIGLSRSSFPADDKMTRVIIAFTGLLVVATLGTAVGTASTPDGEAGVPAERQAAKDAKIPEKIGVAPPITPVVAAPKDTTSSGSMEGAATTVAAGKALFIGAGGCGTCHVYAPADASGKVGPDLTDVGKDDPAAVIKEAIVDPNKEIIKGYAAGVMPADYAKRFTPAQIDSIVSFLKATSK